MLSPADGFSIPMTWVIVAGGVHDHGGMERANAWLVRYLTTTGATVHLVTHEAAPDLVERPRIMLHKVRRIAGLTAADVLLDRAGRRVARTVCRQSPGARVVVNGGNCSWPDVNWVHGRNGPGKKGFLRPRTRARGREPFSS